MKLTIVVAVAAAAISSLPGRACEPTERSLSAVHVPFEGHSVPRNADLAVGGDVFEVVGELVGPDGVAHAVTWTDEVHAEIVPALDADGLAPGRHTLTLRFSEGDDLSSRPILFGVDDRVDTEAAELRFSITRETGGEAVWTPDNPCGLPGYRWPTTFTTLSLDEGVDAAEIAWLEIGGEVYTLNDGSLVVVEDAAIDLTDIVAVDFAGNRSASATLDDTAGGCGCSSTDAPVFVGGLALIAMLRRRRR